MATEPARFLDHWLPAGSASDTAAWLRHHAARPENRGALAHWHSVPARPARHGELALPLPAALTESLESLGATRLYSHQVHAIERLRAGLDTVVVTGTASGKSL